MAESLPQGTIDKIYTLLDEGMSKAQVSREVGISKTSVFLYHRMRDLNLTSINDVHRLEKSRYNPELVELNQAMKHYKENGTFEDFEFDMWNKYANGLIWLPDEIDDGRQIEIMSILLSGPNGVNKLYDISNHTINNTLAHNLNKNGLIEKVKTKKIFIGNLGGKGVLCNNRTSYQKTSLGEELTDHLMNTTFNTNEH